MAHQGSRSVWPRPSSHQLTNLERFAAIRVGDLVAMPAARETYDVHFGVVVPNQTNPTARQGARPTTITTTSPRVIGSRTPIACQCSGIEIGGAPGMFLASLGLGGIWRKSFGRVERARDALIVNSPQGWIHAASTLT